jgi:hypothetical protein
VRFPNHELHPEYEPPIIHWWQSLPQVVTIEPESNPDPEGFMYLVMANKIRQGAESFKNLIDDMFFWAPAREALENGGCRR